MSAAGRPGVMTFVSKAAIGSAFAYFILFVVPFGLDTNPGEAVVLVIMPVFMLLGVIVGAPVGLIIWVCSKNGAAPLHWVYRAVIAVLFLSPGQFYFSLLVFAEPPPAKQQLWLLGWLVLPVIAIALITGSSVRPWRELVRGGEATGRIARLLAGLTGIIVRVTVVLLFMESVLAVICFQRVTGHHDQRTAALLLCGHFTASLAVLFVRMPFWLVAALAAIALEPVIAVLYAVPDIPPAVRYVIFGYLGAWALFLLARWRGTYNAFAFLNEEIHYYLID